MPQNFAVNFMKLYNFFGWFSLYGFGNASLQIRIQKHVKHLRWSVLRK